MTIEQLEEYYTNKPVNDLVKLKRELYGNVDISTPMSDEEKLLNRIIAAKFSAINEEIRQKRLKPINNH